MTVTPLHRTLGHELYDQLDPETLKRAIVVCYHEDGGFSFMTSEVDAGEMALAASILQHHAAVAALGYGDDDD